MNETHIHKKDKQEMKKNNNSINLKLILNPTDYKNDVFTLLRKNKNEKKILWTAISKPNIDLKNSILKWVHVLKKIQIVHISFYRPALEKSRFLTPAASASIFLCKFRSASIW